MKGPRFHGAGFLLAALAVNFSHFSAAAASQTAAPGICGPSPEVRAELGAAADQLLLLAPFPRAQFALAGVHRPREKSEPESLEDEVYESYPMLDDPRKLQERWEAENPAPGAGATPEALEEWARRLLAESRKWTTAAPDDPTLWLPQIEAATLIKGLPLSEVEQAADGLLTALEKRPDSISSYPPPRSQVALLYLAKGFRIEEARRLVERDLAEAAEKEAGASALPPSRRKSEAGKAEAIRWSCWPILVEVCVRTRDLPEARATLAKMQAALSAEESRLLTTKQGRITRENLKATLYVAEAEIATAEGKFSDALASLRNALAIAIHEGSHRRSKFEEKAHAVFAQDGGNERDWKGWLADTTRLAGRPDPRRGWERPRHALPDFDLKDVSGRTWTRADLMGKAVLINVWATWCVPCRAELPEIQSLWEKTRGRKDLLVLTFNTDRDVKLVELFLNENGYRFPVLLASAYWEKNAGEEKAIPQNWLISKSGDLALAGAGFDPNDPNWNEKILALLEEVAQDSPASPERKP